MICLIDGARPEPDIHQLRVLLKGISPLIWQRLLVPGDYSIADLHFILQLAFDWDDWNLHCFFIHGKDYCITTPAELVSQMILIKFNWLIVW